MKTESPIGKRLKRLREDAEVTQTKVAASIGVTQSTINRYEHGLSQAPYDVLVWYADTFDVSLDYIFCRTDKPHGKYFDYQPKNAKENIHKKAEWNEFVLACFEEGSPMNEKLKEMLASLIEDDKK